MINFQEIIINIICNQHENKNMGHILCNIDKLYNIFNDNYLHGIITWNHNFEIIISLSIK